MKKKSNNNRLNNHYNLLIILTNFSPEDNTGTSARAISIFKGIREKNLNVYLMMKQGEKKNTDPNIFLINPRSNITNPKTIIGAILFRFQILISLLSVLRNHQIRIVLLRGFDNVLFLPIFKLFRIKIIIDFHGMDYLIYVHQKSFIRGLLVYICDTILLNLSDIIIVVSEGIKTQINRYSEKCIILPNGVDLTEIRDKTGSTNIKILHNLIIVGFIGNWEPLMKIEDILEAIKNIPNSVALIIGKGHNAEEIIKKYKYSENIVFTGTIPKGEMYYLLNKMTICVIPYSDSFIQSRIKNYYSSRKTLEYLAAGKPIIVSNIIGREKFLESPQNCLLYYPGNPKDLSEKILFLINNKELCKKMSRQNFLLAENYTWEKQIHNSGLIDRLVSIIK